MKKKWWDDWNVRVRPYAGKTSDTVWVGWGKGGEDVVRRFKNSKPNGYYRIDLPHSFGRRTTYKFFTKNKHDDRRIRDLVSLVDCLLYDLEKAKHKWWQFWK